MTRQYEGLETPKGQFGERRAATWVECRLDRRRRSVGIWFTAGGMELDGSGDIHSIAIAGHSRRIGGYRRRIDWFGDRAPSPNRPYPRYRPTDDEAPPAL